MILWHNPRCSKSREALQIITEKNTSNKNSKTLKIREYLKDTPNISEIKYILHLLQKSAHDITRTQEKFWKEININPKNCTEEELITLLSQYPKGIERPIFINENKARVGRPPETVLEIL